MLLRSFFCSFVCSIARSLVRSCFRLFPRSLFARSLLCSVFLSFIFLFVRSLMECRITYIWCQLDQATPSAGVKLTVSKKFGRGHLRKGLSGSKFDTEADAEVHSVIRLPKPRQIDENFNSQVGSKKFVQKISVMRKLESHKACVGKVL